ncbi:MAG: hypothetical protein K6G17_03855 [Oscillospiraceae bacterium]|nr:hypothetical protein [Oscillospiraceae bacterium]
MFEKMKLKKQIKECKQQIEEWEHKRTRSEAALLDAILKHVEPKDEDVDFFNEFTVKIESERAKLRQYMAELEAVS